MHPISRLLRMLKMERNFPNKFNPTEEITMLSIPAANDGRVLRIALLENDRNQTVVLKKWLEDAAFFCRPYTHGKAFLHDFGRESFDLIISDWNLPDSSALHIVNSVRASPDWRLPIVFISLHNQEDDIVRALESGADDYLVRPLRQRETLARIQALMRRCRTRTDNRQQLTLGPYQIDSYHQVISHNDASVALTDKEFKLASLLFQNINRALSRNHLLQSVWNLDQPVPTRTLDTHISSLRVKLNTIRATDLRLRGIYRFGYRLERSAAEDSDNDINSHQPLRQAG
jgi:DNA-binding response OmpR family regulator